MSGSPPEVLILEDEPNLRELMLDVLRASGVAVRTTGSAREAEGWLWARLPDLLIFDLKLPDGDGLSLLEGLRARGVRTPAIIITAFGTVDRAVAALRAGACDFVVKPFDNERLQAAVAAGLAAGERQAELALRVPALDARSGQLVGGGGLKDVLEILPRVAASDATVLIRGESGTGKQVVARAIHESSPRRDGPFVALDCSAIAPSLLEAELFGFERGSFTGAHAQRKGHIESAEGGTLFLDEIGDMPLLAQSRLLRVLQEREICRLGGRTPIKVDVRVLAATHRDLEAAAAAGSFRADLLYRLNVVPIHLPPLRARKQDLPGLFEHFLEKHARRHLVPPPRPAPDLLAALLAHDWPGNVRELENFVERAVVLGAFDLGLLAPRPAHPASGAAPGAEDPDGPEPGAPPPPSQGAVKTLRQAVADAERAAVVAALRAAGGNKAQAARLLGISYKTLFNKIHEHDVKEAVHID